MTTPALPLRRHGDLFVDQLPERPIHLDLGTGLGHFLVELARRHPELVGIGLELDRAVARRAARKVRAAGLANALIVRADARPFLLEAVPPASLDQIWINFPDPWPKDRHAERRHTHPWMIGLLLSRLRPGGLLHLATDVPDYAEAFATALATRPEVEAYAEEPWRRAELGIVTKYERKWRAAGKPLHYADWRLTVPPADADRYPFEPLRPAPRLRLRLPAPPPGIYGEGRWHVKLFPNHEAPDHPRRLLLIDRELGLTTPVAVAATGKLELHGVWTPWKRELLLATGIAEEAG